MKMSSQRGNIKRKRAQRHQNEFAFKNNMHDTSKQKKIINQIELPGLCESCKNKIEWRIKFNKYKPLSQPSKCVKCDQKAIKRAYYVCCDACNIKFNMCGKCLQKKDIVIKIEPKTQSQVDQEFNEVLSRLNERKRRTVLRLLKKGISYYDDQVQKIIEAASNMHFCSDDENESIASDSSNQSTEYRAEQNKSKFEERNETKKSYCVSECDEDFDLSDEDSSPE